MAKVQAAISYQGGPEVWMPACLLYCSSAGAQYVKVMATHPSIVRLACGNRMDLWKGWKNPSLAASPRLGSLAGQLFEAAANVLRGQEEDEVFGAAAGGAAGGHRKARLDFANLPETLELDNHGDRAGPGAPQEGGSVGETGQDHAGGGAGLHLRGCGVLLAAGQAGLQATGSGRRRR